MEPELPRVKGQRSTHTIANRYGKIRATIECTAVGAWIVTGFIESEGRLWTVGDFWAEGDNYVSASHGPHDDWMHLVVEMLAE